MDLEDLERRINENTEKLEKLTELIEHNSGKISKNKEQIEHNTGALAILHTINANSNKYFYMWLSTFTALIASMIYIIFFK